MQFLELAEALAKSTYLYPLLEYLEFIVGDEVVTDETLRNLTLHYGGRTIELRGKYSL